MIKIPTIIAHRGASFSAPENTLVAFKMAKEEGCDWVEFDVVLSKDHVPVIIHDELLDRTTDGHGPVDAHTLAQLKTFDAGGYHDSEFSGEKIPTLEEGLQLCQNLGLKVVLELKSMRGHEAEDALLAKVVCELMTPYLSKPNTYILSSFSPSMLRICRQHYPTQAMGLITFLDPIEFSMPEIDFLKRTVNELQCVSLHINEKCISVDTLPLLATISPNILAWTVNDISRAQALLEMGVCGLFTDKPELLQKFS